MHKFGSPFSCWEISHDICWQKVFLARTDGQKAPFACLIYTVVMWCMWCIQDAFGFHNHIHFARIQSTTKTMKTTHGQFIWIFHMHFIQYFCFIWITLVFLTNYYLMIIIVFFSVKTKKKCCKYGCIWSTPRMRTLGALDQDETREREEHLQSLLLFKLMSTCTTPGHATLSR